MRRAQARDACVPAGEDASVPSPVVIATFKFNVD
jgi:hypothetical protein